MAQIGTYHFSVRQKPKTFREILEGMLPKVDLRQIPHGFDRIGDSVILEIKEQLTPFEREIGTAILASNPSVQAVYVKDSKVHGAQRIQNLRCIAGQEQARIIHLEYGVRLCVAIGKAYFSPRLAQEHVRVATQVQANELVLDMFTGIGPFALHIAKRVEGKIYAVDINPVAIACLQESMKLNKLRGELTPILGDARTIIKDTLQGLCDRVIMNLPNNASEYLVDAVFAVKPVGGIIHFYTFETEPTPEEKAKSTLSEIIEATGATIQILNTHKIKEVAPRTNQVVVDALIRPK
jgi:tRNA (guanine37-N1)-methyltransferase